MLPSIFRDWLHEFDHRMGQENRHVLLLVKNSACYQLIGGGLKNVSVRLLPSNQTKHMLQPVMAGVFHAFKTHYRLGLLQHYVQFAKISPSLIDVQEAVALVSKAWNAVTAESITISFSISGILLPSRGSSRTNADALLSGSSGEALVSSDLPVLEVANLMSRLASPEDVPLSVDDFLRIDAAEPTGEAFTDIDILGVVSDENDSGEFANSCDDQNEEDSASVNAVCKDENTDDSGDGAESSKRSGNVPSKVARHLSTSEAIQHVQSAMAYFEQHFANDDERDDNRAALVELGKINELLYARMLRRGNWHGSVLGSVSK